MISFYISATDTGKLYVYFFGAINAVCSFIRLSVDLYE